MSDIFVSYARSTATEAERVADALRALGYGVWRDDELPAHRAYGEVIEERLKAAKAVVVIWSADAAKSEWVQSEADQARAARKLVQLTVDGAKLPMPFDRIQCADLSGWTGEAAAPGWRKVVASLAELTGGLAAAPPERAPAARGLSICVLPFANMSEDVQQEYFSDGVSEDIITDLSKVSALTVVSRNSAFQYKGRNVDLIKVARELNVSHVLEGSVRKAGARVRVTAQLIDGATNDNIWSERYDRDLTDIFALQDELSQAIVAALKLRLLPEEKKAIARRGTDNVEAYNLYLMARQQLVSNATGDPRREESIVRLTRAAADLDPGYARAWALMAWSQMTLRFSHGRPEDDGLASAERAIALDPDLAEAHAVKARYLDERGLARECDVEIDLALTLDPESYDVNITAATIRVKQHRFEDAIGHFEKAAALAETEVGSVAVLITCYGAVGDAEGVRRAARMTLERAEKALGQDPNNSAAMGWGGAALAALGEVDRAKAWIWRAMLIDPDNNLMRYNFACALSLHLKDPQGALDLLGPYFAKTSRSMLNYARIDPDLDPIRADPRFEAMMTAADARLDASEGISPPPSP